MDCRVNSGLIPKAVALSALSFFLGCVKKIVSKPVRVVVLAWSLSSFGSPVQAVAAVQALFDLSTLRAPQCSALPDYPDAVGTISAGINDNRLIVGAFDDACGQRHGYSYSLVTGQYAAIDFPDSILTSITDVNNDSVMAGRYRTGDNVIHAFQRSADGTFKSVDVPGAIQTKGDGINSEGGVAGDYCTAGIAANCAYNSMTNGNTHGFLWEHNIFYAVDVPDATYTEAWKHDPSSGRIFGRFRDIDGNPHAFLMGPDGDVESIDVPNAVETAGRNYSDLGNMNTRGDIVATYCDISPCPATAPDFVTHPGAVHGFLRTKRGEFFSLDAPGAVGSEAFGINNRGDIIGAFRDKTDHTHGFICQTTESNDDDNRGDETASH